MPPKHKEKKPKLTKEEKKANKLIAAELRRRQIKKDHLEREIRLGEFTKKKHEQEWRKMMMKISLPQVREELEFAWHTFERVIDAKDFTISLLMDEVQNAEEQYMLNFRSHCNDIDKLIVMFRDRLVELKEHNERDIAEMRTFQDNESSDFKRTFEHDDRFIKVMIFGLRDRRKVHEDAARADYISRLDEEQSKFVDFLQKQRAFLENVMSEIWDEYKRLFNGHLSDTEDRRKGYLALKKQDDYMTKLLADQLKRIQRSYELLKRLSSQHSLSKNVQDQKIRDLQIERQFFSDSLKALKHRLADESMHDRRQMALVTIESNKSMEVLNRVEEQGVFILKIGQVCRQLETKLEKIMQFPETGIGELRSPLEVEKCVESHLSVYDDLRNFWQRVAQSDAFRIRLKEELEQLKRENFMLHCRVHEFCECAVCLPTAVPARRINFPSIDEASCVQSYLV